MVEKYDSSFLRNHFHKLSTSLREESFMGGLRHHMTEILGKKKQSFKPGQYINHVRAYIGWTVLLLPKTLALK